MSKLVIANWKMNLATVDEAAELSRESDFDGLVICPSFPFLKTAGDEIKNAKLGAQDVFWEFAGAYTGEVSAAQLKSLGVEFVIIGHSERRQNLGETDEMVSKKVKAVFDVGLTPVLCVGESGNERAAGKTEEVVKREVEIGLSLLKNNKSNRRPTVVIAYEPIWAIGTGIPDAPENTISVVKLIRSITDKLPFQIQVIYGGSVNSKNAEKFLQHKEIEGALVGGASLKGEEIKQIIKIAKKYHEK